MSDRLIPGSLYTLPGPQHVSRRTGRPRVYEFSRMGCTGLAIVHEPGEPDMQSCLAVDPSLLVPYSE